jgi:hypothetical protein
MFLQLRMVASTAADVAFNVPITGCETTLTPRGIVNFAGYKCTPEALLPDWNCAELLRATLIQLGAFISVDERAKTVSILEAQQINVVKGRALDWSKKLVNAQPYNTDVDFGGFVGTNWLRFTDDSDAPKQLGDGSFQAMPGSSESKTYLQSPFSPSAKSYIGVTAQSAVAKITHWQQSSDGTSWQEYSTNTVRIVMVEPLGRSVTFRINNVSYFPTNPPVATFGDYYLNGDGAATLEYAAGTAYAPIAQWAANGRRFTARFRLSLADIYALSAMQTVGAYQFCGILNPVSVPQMNGTFLIENISQWVSEDIPCEVTLTKIG